MKKPALTLVIVSAVLLKATTAGNLATGKNSYQSTTSSLNGTQQYANLAIDGRVSGELATCSQTNVQKDPWWLLDLGSRHEIGFLTIKNRADCCWNELRNLEIRIGFHGENGFQNNSLCTQRFGGFRSSEHIILWCGQPLLGQYVSIQILSDDGQTNQLTLCEVQVFEFGKVRLEYAGRYGSYGRLELFDGSLWGTVCEITQETAKAVCKFLGYNINSIPRVLVDASSVAAQWKSLSCPTTAHSLDECTRESNQDGDHCQVPAIDCDPIAEVVVIHTTPITAQQSSQVCSKFDPHATLSHKSDLHRIYSLGFDFCIPGGFIDDCSLYTVLQKTTPCFGKKYPGEVNLWAHNECNSVFKFQATYCNIYGDHISRSGCPEGWQIMEYTSTTSGTTRKCFKIVDVKKAATREEANSYCKNQTDVSSPALASINNAEEQAALMQLLLRAGYKNRDIMIGLKTEGNRWAWLDRSTDMFTKPLDSIDVDNYADKNFTAHLNTGQQNVWILKDRLTSDRFLCKGRPTHRMALSSNVTSIPEGGSVLFEISLTAMNYLPFSSLSFFIECGQSVRQEVTDLSKTYIVFGTNLFKVNQTVMFTRAGQCQPVLVLNTTQGEERQMAESPITILALLSSYPLRLGTNLQVYLNPPGLVTFTIKYDTHLLDTTSFYGVKCELNDGQGNSLSRTFKPNRDLQMSLNYTYPITALGTFNVTVTCSNMLGSSVANSSVSLMQPIDDVSLNSRRWHYLVHDTVSFFVLCKSGSHVEYRLFYGDGGEETKATSYLQCNKEPVLFNHTYREEGNYTIEVHADNFLDSYSSREQMVIQNPVSLLDMVVSYPIVYPEGKTKFRIVHKGNATMRPSAVHVVWNFSHGVFEMTYAASLSSSGTYEISKVFNRSFVGDFTVTANVSNLVSHQLLTVNATMEETITVLRIVPKKLIAKRGETVEFFVSAKTGSTVNFNLTFGDGHYDNKAHPELLVDTKDMVFKHMYVEVGNFTPAIAAKNLVSEEKADVGSPLVVQDPIGDYSLTCTEKVQFPDGVANCELKADNTPIPTDVHCTWYHSSRPPRSTFVGTLTAGKTHRVSFQARLVDIGQVYIRVNCSNLVSVSKIYGAEILVVEKIKALRIEVNPMVVETNTACLLTVMGNGTGASYKLDFGDGTVIEEQTNISKDSVGARLTFSKQHIYKAAGTYNVSVFADNGINVENATTIVGVQNGIHNLTVSTNSPVAFPDNKAEIRLRINTDMFFPTDLVCTIDPGDGSEKETLNVKETESHLFVHEHSYTQSSIGINTVRVDCHNIVTRMEVLQHIKVEERVTDVSIRNEGDTCKTKTKTKFEVMLGRGSHVNITVCFGDSTCSSQIFNRRILTDEVIAFHHAYLEAGFYNVSVTVSNQVSYNGGKILKPVVVQNPITTLEATYDKLIVFPPGEHHVKINTYNTTAPPTAVQCTWLYSDGTNETVDASGFSLHHVLNHVKIYTRKSIGVINTIVNCSNLVSYQLLDILADMEEEISDLNVTADERVIETYGSVTFTISIATGSHVTYVINFGDGVSRKLISTSIGSYRNNVKTEHVYKKPGRYTVHVSASNQSTKKSKIYRRPIIVQNELKYLVVTGESLVSLSEGTMVMTLTAQRDFPPSEVTCSWHFGNGSTSTAWSPNLSNGLSHDLTYELSVNDVGRRTTIVNCSNLISHATTNLTVTVLADVTGIKLIPSRFSLATNDIVEFSLSARSGTNISCTVFYGDGTNQTEMHSHEHAQNGLITYRHKYITVGNYHPRSVCNNLVSSHEAFTTEAVVVENPIEQLFFNGTNLINVPPGKANFTLGVNEGVSIPTGVTIRVYFEQAKTKVLDLPEAFDSQHPLTFSHVFSELFAGKETHVKLFAFNRVSNFSSTISITCQEGILGLTITPRMAALQPGEWFNLNISMLTGTDLQLNLKFGDNRRLQERLGSKHIATFQHSYDSEGTFVISAVVSNKLGYSETSTTIVVQHKITHVVIHASSPVRLPDQEAEIEISAKDTAKRPQRVNATVFFGDNQVATLTDFNFTSNITLRHNYSVGVFQVTAVLWNRVNKASVSAQVIACESIQGLRIETIEPTNLHLKNPEPEIPQFQMGVETHWACGYSSGSNLTSSWRLPNGVVNTFAVQSTAECGLKYVLEQSGLRNFSITLWNMVDSRSAVKVVRVHQTAKIKKLTLDPLLVVNTPYTAVVTLGNEIQDGCVVWDFGDGSPWTVYGNNICRSLNVSRYVDLDTDKTSSAANMSLSLDTSTHSNTAVYTTTIPKSLSSLDSTSVFDKISMSLSSTQSHKPSSSNSGSVTTSATITTGKDSYEAVSFENASTPKVLSTSATYNDQSTSTPHVKNILGSSCKSNCYHVFLNKIPQKLSHKHTYKSVGDYRVTVRLINLVSEDYTTNDVVVYKPEDKINCYPPTVAFKGVNRNSFADPYQSVRSVCFPLQVNAKLHQICPNASGVFYTWRLERFDPQNETFYGISLPSMPTSGPDDNKIKLPKSSLEIELHRLTVEVTVSPYNVSTQRQMYLRITSSSVKTAIVGGPFVRVSTQNNFSLNAMDMSVDPDVEVDNKTGMDFTWYCRRLHPPGVSGKELADFSDSCDLAGSEGHAIKVNDVGERLVEKRGIFTVAPHVLKSNSTYSFTVEMRKDKRKAVFTQTVEVIEGITQRITCNCIKNCNAKANPSLIMTLQAICTEFCAEDLQWEWKILETSGTSNQLSEASGLNLTTQGDLLHIQPNSLVGGKQYKVLLDSISANATGRVEYNFIANVPPSGGSCTVQPTTGVALNTSFSVECSGWTDEGDKLRAEDFGCDEEPTYRVYSRARGQSKLTLLKEGGPVAYPLSLPVGAKEFNYSVDVIVMVMDKYGTANTVEFETQVLNPLAGLSDEKKAELLKSATDDVGSELESNPQAACQKIMGIVSSMEGEDGAVNKGTSSQVRNNIVESMNKTYKPKTSTAEVMQSASAMSAVTKQKDEISAESEVAAAGTMGNMADDVANLNATSEEEFDDAFSQLRGAMGSMMMSNAVANKSALDTKSKAKEAAKAKSVQEAFDRAQEAMSVSKMKKMSAGAPAFKMGDKKSPLVLKKDTSDSLTKGSPMSNGLGEVGFGDLDLENEGEEISTQMASYQDNPFSYAPSADDNSTDDKPSSPITSIQMYGAGGKKIKLAANKKFATKSTTAHTSAPSSDQQHDSGISLAIKPKKAESPKLVTRPAPSGNYSMCYHKFSTNGQSGVLQLFVKPVMNVSFNVYVGFDGFPTPQSFDYMATFPKGRTDIAADDDLQFTLAIQLNKMVPGTKFLGIQQVSGKGALLSTQIYESGVTEDSLADIASTPMTRDQLFPTTFPTFNASHDNEHTQPAKSRQRRSAQETMSTTQSPPVGNETTNGTDWFSKYYIQFYELTCQRWDEEKQKWVTECKVDPDSSPNKVKFKSNLFGNFGAGLFVPPNTIDFSNIFKDLDKKLAENAPVVATISAILGLYFLLIILARRADKKDRRRWTYNPLIDNHSDDQYGFKMSVFTGSKTGAGTKSKVFFVLSGEESDTGLRIMDDGIRENFKKGAVDNFYVSSPHSIGNLLYLRVWHDNTGGLQNSWFLEKIIVSDVITGKKYYFLCDKWLSKKHDDLRVDRIIPVADKERLKDSASFSKSARRDMTEDHLMVSVASRPVPSNFTRVQRLSCLVSILFLTMISNAMWYKTDEEKGGKPSARLTIGPVSFTMNELYTSVMSTLTVLPANIAILYFFRNSKRRSKKIHDEKTAKTTNWRKLKKKNKKFDNIWASSGSKSYSEWQHYPRVDVIEKASFTDWWKRFKYSLKSSKKKPVLKKRRSRKLPFWFVYIGWLLVFASIATSAAFTVFYALEWGGVKSTGWLTAFLLSVFQDTFIVNPIKVLAFAALFSLVFKKPPDVDDDEDEDDTAICIKVSDNPIARTTAPPPLPEEPADPEAEEKEKEEIRRQKLRENVLSDAVKDFLSHSLYLFLLLSIAYGMRDYQMYTMNQEMNKLFADGTGYEEVATAANFWTWLETSMISNLYYEKLYNGMPTNVSYDRKFISNGVSMRMSPARLRQLRVSPKQCLADRSILAASCITQCYQDYSVTTEDTENMTRPYQLVHHENPTLDLSSALVFQNKSVLKSEAVWAQLAWYSGNGYVAQIPQNYKEAVEYIRRLRALDWVDRYTRAVFVEFTVFTMNVNLFTSVRLAYELPTVGAAVISKEITSFNLYRYTGSAGVMSIFAEVVCMLYTLYFTIVEIVKIVKTKREYLKSNWNIANLVACIFMWACMGMYTEKNLMTMRTIEDVFNNKGKYVSFDSLIFIDMFFMFLFAIVVFITQIRFVNTLRFQKHVAIMTKTVIKSGKDASWFVSTFLIIFIGFLFLGVTWFAAECKLFSNIWHCSMYLMTLMVGYNSTPETEKLSLGPIYFFLYNFIGLWVLTGMLLSILQGAHCEALEEEEMNRTDINMAEYFWTKVKAMIPFFNQEREEPRNAENDEASPTTATHRTEDLERY